MALEISISRLLKATTNVTQSLEGRKNRMQAQIRLEAHAMMVGLIIKDLNPRSSNPVTVLDKIGSTNSGYPEVKYLKNKNNPQREGTYNNPGTWRSNKQRSTYPRANKCFHQGNTGFRPRQRKNQTPFKNTEFGTRVPARRRRPQLCTGRASIKKVAKDIDVAPAHALTKPREDLAEGSTGVKLKPRSKCYTATLQIGGIVTKALIDTGAECTVILEEFLNSNLERFSRYPSSTVTGFAVSGAVGGPIGTP